jgi:4-hydroxy-tetrahydrodipicolinate synthase
MNTEKLKGTGVAIVTPFTTHGDIDFVSLERLLEHLIKGGVEYLVVQGTTGESVTMTDQERMVLFSFVREKVDGRVGLVAGVGGNDTMKTAKQMKAFDLEGYQAILSVTPYYNKPTQEGLYRHFAYLAEHTPLPIILYNVPGRTAVNLLPETTLRLAKGFSNIIGIKEASGNVEQIMQIIMHKPKGFLVISGDDNLTMPLVAAGAVGVISVVANVFPQQYSDMVRATLAGDLVHARKLHYSLMDLTNLLFAEGNPAGAKAALQLLGICEATVRLPLVEASETLTNRIVEQIKVLQF